MNRLERNWETTDYKEHYEESSPCPRCGNNTDNRELLDNADLNGKNQMCDGCRLNYCPECSREVELIREAGMLDVMRKCPNCKSLFLIETKPFSKKLQYVDESEE